MKVLILKITRRYLLKIGGIVMEHLVPTFVMFLVLLAIIAVARYLKSRTPEIIHPFLLIGTVGLSLYTIFKMLPGVLSSALRGVIENVSIFSGFF